MLNKFNIGKRLGYAFGLINILCLTIGFISFYQASLVKTQWEDIKSNILIKKDATQTATSELASAIANFKNYILRGGDYQQKFLADINNFENALKIYNSSHSLNDEEKQIISDLTQSVVSYRSSMDKLVELRAKNYNSNELDKLVKGTTSALLDNLKKLSKISNFYSDKADIQFTETNNQAQKIIIIALAIIAISSIIISSVVTKSITRPLKEVLDQAAKISSGDLSSNHLKSEASSHAIPQNEISHLTKEINTMRGNLVSIIDQINELTESITTSADELSSSTQQVTISIKAQADQTASSASAIEELSVSIDHVSENAMDSATKASGSGKMANEGGVKVIEIVKMINNIANSVDNTAKEIHALSNQINNIKHVANEIKEIADQTNLLALNASIEAARAGETGRGFAVVADEVRKLADRTTQSVLEITGMLHSIQSSTHASVNAMETSREMVLAVVDSSKTIVDSMSNIFSTSKVVQDSISEISSALNEQRSAATVLAQGVEAVAQMSEENSTTISVVSKNAHNLSSIANALRASVRKFKV